MNLWLQHADLTLGSKCRKGRDECGAQWNSTRFFFASSRPTWCHTVHSSPRLSAASSAGPKQRFTLNRSRQTLLSGGTYTWHHCGNKTLGDNPSTQHDITWNWRSWITVVKAGCAATGSSALYHELQCNTSIIRPHPCRLKEGSASFLTFKKSFIKIVLTFFNHILYQLWESCRWFILNPF